MITRREATAGSAFVPLASVGPTTRTYTDSAVTKGQRVCYVVVAYREPGEVSGASNEVCTRIKP